jgi:hypothetical protein
MSNITHLQDGNAKVKFKSRILEKIHVGSETGSGYGSTTLNTEIPDLVHVSQFPGCQATL